jgi:dTDP-4-amino-4,6-dideoxygalactose transaminase
MVFTKSEELYWRARRYADRGKPFGVESDNGNVVASLNCNMDEIHAAIGRAQLRKLPGILHRRRELAKMLADGCRDRLQAFRPADELPDTEGCYWFLLLRVDLQKLRVDKDTVVKALQAEGIAVAPGYRHIPTQMAWAKNRRVFGSSGLPWSAREYEGNPDQEYPLPNIEETEAQHIHVSFHEDWSREDMGDVLTALEKVENAYRK